MTMVVRDFHAKVAINENVVELNGWCQSNVADDKFVQ